VQGFWWALQRMTDHPVDMVYIMDPASVVPRTTPLAFEADIFLRSNGGFTATVMKRDTVTGELTEIDVPSSIVRQGRLSIGMGLYDPNTCYTVDFEWATSASRPRVHEGAAAAASVCSDWTGNIVRAQGLGPGSGYFRGYVTAKVSASPAQQGRGVRLSLQLGELAAPKPDGKASGRPVESLRLSTTPKMFEVAAIDHNRELTMHTPFPSCPG
jgi:hypothetical protein